MCLGINYKLAYTRLYIGFFLFMRVCPVRFETFSDRSPLFIR